MLKNNDLQTHLRTVTTTLIILLVVGYALFQARNLIQGPVITILSPENGSTVTESLVEVRGIARNIIGIKFNDRDIVMDEDGHCSEQLLLAPGYTIMSILARDRFGRTTSKSLELFYAL